MAPETNKQDALRQLADSTAEAVLQTLSTLLDSPVELGETVLLNADQDPFAELPLGGVATSVQYVDGVTGANILLLPVACARSLSGAMGMAAAGSGSLSDLELSAVGEAANQMLAAASAAISVVIGQEIQISPPEVTVLDGRPGIAHAWGTAPFASSTTFTVGEETCRLVQLVPSAFVLRMARALDELHVDDGAGVDGDRDSDGLPLNDKLHGISLRVWAELGRTQIGIGSALELPAGAVVDLDRAADAPVDLFVNGLCFGQGQLLVTDDGEWAIEVSSLMKPSVRRETAN